MAKLLFDGVYQEVVVDDLIPVKKDGTLAGSQPQQRGNRCDIWVMILEKCWAKLLQGYEYINCNNQFMQHAGTKSPFMRSLELQSSLSF
jgi:hypothetical protein